MARDADLHLAVIDLETTGSDEHEGSLLEVGLIIVDQHLRELWRASWLVEPNIVHVATMPEAVRRMHVENGLLAEIDHHRAQWLAGRYPDTIVDTPGNVDGQLAHVLDQHTVDGKIALAGSGVAHFDSRWLRTHLPESSKRLTYWAHDVGSVRRFLRDLVGLAIDFEPHEIKSHRALDDAEQHLDEMRYYRDQLRIAQQAVGELNREPVGTRVEDGGIMGTIVSCEQCSGSGRLHDPDELPPISTPQCGQPLGGGGLCRRDGNHTGEHRETPDIAF